MAGLLKLFAVLGVLALASLGCLFVLDVIPRDVFEEVLPKVLGVIAILGAASLVIAMLIRRKE